MCSHRDADPGPPLNRNATGRVLLSETSLRTYATEYIKPIVSPASFLIDVVPAAAVYGIDWPESFSVCWVVDHSSPPCGGWVA